MLHVLSQDIQMSYISLGYLVIIPTIIITIVNLMKHKVMGLLILMGYTFSFSTVENMTIANLRKNIVP